MPLVSSSTCIGASAGNHTIIGYGNIGGCFTGDIIITPSTTGGGTSSAIGNQTQLEFFYNTGFLCNQTRTFLEEIGKNYTQKELTKFKNSLTIQMGFGIEDNVLIDLIEDFEINCVEKKPKSKPLSITPIVDGKFNLKGLFFAILVLLIAVVLIVIWDNKIRVKSKRKDK